MSPDELSKISDEELEERIADARPNQYVPGSVYHVFVAEQEKRRYQKLLAATERQRVEKNSGVKKTISPKVVKMLFALSGKICPFPGCATKIIEGGVVNAHIAHIEAEKPGGARYNEDQSGEERFSYDNLILLCPTHHALVDKDPTTYTVEFLKGLKPDNHSQESEVTLDFSYRAESRTSSEHQYVLEIMLKNNSERSISKPKLKITMPDKTVRVISHRGKKETNGNIAEIYFEVLDIYAIHPGEKKKLMGTPNVGLRYIMTNDLFDLPEVMNGEFKVEVLAENHNPIVKVKHFKEMQQF